MNQAERIIKKFGGINAMARALGHRNASTVQGWDERGSIPPKQHQAVWDAARSAGVKIELQEFAAVAPERAAGRPRRGARA